MKCLRSKKRLNASDYTTHTRSLFRYLFRSLFHSLSRAHTHTNSSSLSPSLPPSLPLSLPPSSSLFGVSVCKRALSHTHAFLTYTHTLPHTCVLYDSIVSKVDEDTHKHPPPITHTSFLLHTHRTCAVRQHSEQGRRGHSAAGSVP